MSTDSNKAGRRAVIDLVRARTHAELDAAGDDTISDAVSAAMGALSSVEDVIDGVAGALDAASALLTIAVMLDDEGGVSTPPAVVRRRLEAVLLAYEPLAAV